MTCISVVLNNLGKRRYGARRRSECFRPLPRIAVDPHRLHSGLCRADDVRQRIIADVQHLRGLDAGQLEERGVYPRVGLRGARRARRDVAVE